MVPPRGGLTSNLDVASGGWSGPSSGRRAAREGGREAPDRADGSAPRLVGGVVVVLGVGLGLAARKPKETRKWMVGGKKGWPKLGTGASARWADTDTEGFLVCFGPRPASRRGAAHRGRVVLFVCFVGLFRWFGGDSCP